MTNTTKTIHEPLFHVAKREKLPTTKAILIRVYAILVAIAISSILCLIFLKVSPITMFLSMIKGTFGTSKNTWKLLHELAILLGISLAVAPAFKMKFWNCGADGQTLVGGLACAACMHYLSDLPNGILIPIMLLASITAGVIWAAIPAIFKAFYETNETLFTLMMNYISIQLVLYFTNTWITNPETGKLVFTKLPLFKVGLLPKVFNAYLLNILIVALLTVAVYIYLKHTKQGYEVAIVGESKNTAKYIGISNKKVIIRTMIISGAICGIIGFLLVAGYNHTIDENLVNGRGFTAILVTWLGKVNPLYMILTSFLVVFLSTGTTYFTDSLKLGDSSFANILTAIAFFCIIACEFFVVYKIKFRKKNIKTVNKKLEVKDND